MEWDLCIREASELVPSAPLCAVRLVRLPWEGS
jgi:hypothetical protein